LPFLSALRSQCVAEPGANSGYADLKHLAWGSPRCGDWLSGSPEGASGVRVPEAGEVPRFYKCLSGHDMIYRT
jgi:hypothetical protein